MADYDLTQEFEGWSPEVYTDTTGNPTIGWGFNLNDRLVRSMIPKDVRRRRRQLSKEEAAPIFQALYQRALQDAQNQIGKQVFNTLPPAAQNVFTDMSYNLGGEKFGGFHDMIAGARQQNWNTVAKEMQDSNWYKQVGRRSEKLQRMILSLSKQKK